LEKSEEACGLYNRGVDLEKLGKHEAAIECFDKAIEIDSKFEEAWFNKGYALGELGKLETAIECYDKAIEIKHNNEHAWHNKGVNLEKLGKHEAAIECYDKAIEINPNYAKSWYNKGAILEELGKHKDAQKYYDRAHKLAFDQVLSLKEAKGIPKGEYDLPEDPSRTRELDLANQYLMYVRTRAMQEANFYHH
jgi:tetratricopeptide (TPR) repeat protein